METPNSLEQAKDLQEKIVALRRVLNSHPELAFEEFQTASILAEHFESLGFSVSREIAGTGLFAQTGQGPLIAIHAAMDAVTQDHCPAGSSKGPVAFHGCGHDANMACVAGAARIIARRLRNQNAGSARIIFQPATEKTNELGLEGGAWKLIQAGAITGCNAILGLHVDSTIRAGKIGIVRAAESSKINQQIEEIMQGAASDLAGPTNVFTLTRTTYGCDFCKYLELIPGALIYLGVGIAGRPCSHHSPDFIIDESVLHIGAAVLAETVFRLLKVDPKLIGCI